MKIAITGHTAGIGQALANAYHGNEIVGLSRREGHNIRVTPKLADQIESCDMWVNNAQVGFAQTELLFEIWRRWEGQHKIIVNISTQMTDMTVPPKREWDEYIIQKKALELAEGKLYAVFNNGAYGQPGALEDLPTEALQDQFQTNFFGWHQLVREVLPHMRIQGEGRIIQNSSVLGFAAMKYRGAYNASKFALEGWTDTLRLELADTNIKVALIEPGPIETQFRNNALKAFEKWIDIE